MIQDAWLAFHRNNLWRLACRSDRNSRLRQSCVSRREPRQRKRHGSKQLKDCRGLASQTQPSHPSNTPAPPLKMKTVRTWSSQHPGRANSVHRSSKRSFRSLFGPEHGETCSTAEATRGHHAAFTLWCVVQNSQTQRAHSFAGRLIHCCPRTQCGPGCVCGFFPLQRQLAERPHRCGISVFDPNGNMKSRWTVGEKSRNTHHRRTFCRVRTTLHQRTFESAFSQKSPCRLLFHRNLLGVPVCPVSFSYHAGHIIRHNLRRFTERFMVWFDC